MGQERKKSYLLLDGSDVRSGCPNWEDISELGRLHACHNQLWLHYCDFHLSLEDKGRIKNSDQFVDQLWTVAITSS